MFTIVQMRFFTRSSSVILKSALACLLIVIPALNGIGASVSHTESDLKEIEKVLSENRSKWASKGIKNYRYKFEWRCYCAPEHVAPVIISIRNGSLYSVASAKDGAPVNRSRYDNYRTIDELFDLIQDGITKQAHQIRVSYDPELGYPASAYIDYKEQMADEENGFKAQDVTPIR